MRITRAFLSGMNELAAQEIQIIDVIDKHIEFCTGCFSCMRNGGNCIYTYDMKNILEEILSSNLLIWSFPLYCYGMPAPLKALLSGGPSCYHNPRKPAVQCARRVNSHRAKVNARERGRKTICSNRKNQCRNAFEYILPNDI